MSLNRSKGYVLIVEDEPDIANLIKAILEGDGLQANIAKDGETALIMINQRKPAVLFLDLSLPKMNGYQVMEILKVNSQTSDIPIIVCSTKKGLLDMKKTRDLGAVAYIMKPFEPEEITSRLNLILGPEI